MKITKNEEKILDLLCSKCTEIKNGEVSSGYDFGVAKGLVLALDVVSSHDTSEVKKYIDDLYIKWINNNKK